METVRTIRLAKVPGVAETLDWAQALYALHADHLDEDLVAVGTEDVARFDDDLAGVGRVCHDPGAADDAPAMQQPIVAQGFVAEVDLVLRQVIGGYQLAREEPGPHGIECRTAHPPLCW